MMTEDKNLIRDEPRAKFISDRIYLKSLYLILPIHCHFLSTHLTYTGWQPKGQRNSLVAVYDTD